MKWINISDEMLGMLEPYSDWFFNQDLSWIDELSKKNEKNNSTLEVACSEDYLNEIVEKDGQHIGYPEVSYSYDLNQGGIPGEFQEKYLEITK